MKKSIFAFLLFFAFSAKNTYAHKEWVHQYMVKQSYLFLESKIGTIPILRSAVGLNYVGQGDDILSANSGASIGTGAWREDIDDIVYGYKTSNIFPPDVNDYTPSITHFWKADKGDDDRLNLVIGGNGGNGGTYTNAYPNAWAKARVLLFCETANGPHQIKIWYHPWKDTGGSARLYAISYTSLPELYKGNFFLDYIDNGRGNIGQRNHERISNPNFDDGFPKKVALQILGRVAHLLGDMSVPAHTHNHLHPCPAGYPDKYENHLGNTFYSNNSIFSCENFPGENGWAAYNWTASTAAQQGGLINDIYCENGDYNKIRFLFYTLNQISDFFPSGVDPLDKFDPTSGAFGGYQTLQIGNANYSGPYNTHIETIYNQYQKNPPTTINIQNIGDATFNFSIRATATLFQWFAFNAGIIDNLTNTKIVNSVLSSSSNYMCAAVTPTSGTLTAMPLPFRFEVPGVLTSDINWSISPSSAASGRLIQVSGGSRFNPVPVYAYEVTPTADNFPGIVTVTANYNKTDGCYPTTNFLKRELWKGSPQPANGLGLITPQDPNINILVEPGASINLSAEILKQELQPNLTYSWSSSNSSLAVLYSKYTTITAPNSPSQEFIVEVVVRNSCGSIYGNRRFQTKDVSGVAQTINIDDKKNKKINTNISNISFEVYPNPSDNEFYIKQINKYDTESAEKYDSEFILLDALSRKVKQGHINQLETHVSTQRT